MPVAICSIPKARRTGIPEECASQSVPGSPARGADFQVNPATGDRRTSGSAAGLAGVESAVELGDDAACDLAIARLLCGYAMVLGYGGIPLLYMGDEIGLGTDHGYLDDPARRDDNRWMHRPFMDWDLAAQRHDASTAAGRVIRHCVVVAGFFVRHWRTRQHLEIVWLVI